MKSVLCQTPLYECDYSDNQAEKGVLFGNHCHLTCEFMLILDGFVSVAIENKTYRNLSKGTLVMIAPLTYHSSFSTVPSRYRRITVRFFDSAIPQEIREDVLDRMRKSPVLSLENAGFLSESLYRAINEKDTVFYSPLIESVMTQLFYYPLRDGSFSIGAEQIGGEKDAVLQSVISYIDAHMEENVKLSELAEHSFVSVSSLCHLFQSQMKISVKQYVLQKKIHYAAGLMQSGVSASKAAEMIGYKNYADFYAVYKKTTGETPSQKKMKKGL